MVHHLSHGLFVLLRGDAVHGALRPAPSATLRRRWTGGISGGGRRGIDSLAVVERVEAPKLRERRRGRPRATRGPPYRSAATPTHAATPRVAHAERGEAAAAGRVRRAAALDDGQQGGVLVRGHCSAGVLISRRSSAGPRRSVARNDERSGGGTSSLGIRRGTKRRDDSTSRALGASRVWRAFACGGRGARTRAHTKIRNLCPSWVLRIQTILPNYLTECLLSTVHFYKCSAWRFVVSIRRVSIFALRGKARIARNRAQSFRAVHFRARFTPGCGIVRVIGTLSHSSHLVFLTTRSTWPHVHSAPGSSATGVAVAAASTQRNDL